MVRLTDQQKADGPLLTEPRRGPWGGVRASQGAEGEAGEVWAAASTVVSRECRGQGRASRLRGPLSHVSKLWDTVAWLSGPWCDHGQRFCEACPFKTSFTLGDSGSWVLRRHLHRRTRAQVSWAPRRATCVLSGVR